MIGVHGEKLNVSTQFDDGRLLRAMGCALKRSNDHTQEWYG